jgi:hypothetical protein
LFIQTVAGSLAGSTVFPGTAWGFFKVFYPQKLQMTLGLITPYFLSARKRYFAAANKEYGRLFPSGLTCVEIF